jgi:hypothetical protein
MRFVVVLEKHEMATVVFLTNLGLDVELVPPSGTKGASTPDIKINGVPWEMKSPRGQGRWLIENTLQKAVKQSHNVIVDLRRIKIHQTKCLQELEKQFYHSRGLIRLRVITKARKIIDFKK